MTDDRKAASLRLDVDAYGREAIERLKFQVTLADAALRNLMLINGGAMIALFTFVGNVAGKGVITLDMNKLWVAFAFFTAGLILTMLAQLAAFLSQGHYYMVAQQQAWNAQFELDGEARREDFTRSFQAGVHSEFAGLAGASLALLCFVIGAGTALSGVAG